MKTLHGSMRAMHGAAYFPWAISYTHKCFMKLTKSLYEKVLSHSTFCLLLLERDLSWEA